MIYKLIKLIYYYHWQAQLRINGRIDSNINFDGKTIVILKEGLWISYYEYYPGDRIIPCDIKINNLFNVFREFEKEGFINWE
jgi:hypothetical protein